MSTIKIEIIPIIENNFSRYNIMSDIDKNYECLYDKKKKRRKVILNMKIGRNSITDVPGIKVGHYTIDTPEHQTGVTVILPCEDDIFQNKMVAACHVLNGFGKTTGLVQIEELGTLETPIALTNTLNVGLVHDAIVEYMCQQAEENQYSIMSVNPII